MYRTAVIWWEIQMLWSACLSASARNFCDEERRMLSAGLFFFLGRKVPGLIIEGSSLLCVVIDLIRIYFVPMHSTRKRP
jgi:hypothetical protein